jgi:hypothetical protein
MHAEDLLDQLVDLARAAGLEVRTIGRAGPGERETPSGTCRVKAAVWVMLSEADSLDDRIDVLAAALALHAADRLEARYLPPAIRERLAAARSAAVDDD